MESFFQGLRLVLLEIAACLRLYHVENIDYMRNVLYVPFFFLTDGVLNHAGRHEALHEKA